jgi:hypothetical protein
MDGAGKDRAVFELMNAGPSVSGPKVLGLWETLPRTPSAATAFDLTSTTVAPEPLWRARLPSDLNLAASQLTVGEARLQTSRKALNAVPDRLNGLFLTHTTGSSFDVSSAVKGLAQPEADLLVSLQLIQDGAATLGFGLGDKLTAAWQHTSQDLQEFGDQVLQSIAHYARVETYVGDQFLGRTAVSWTGNVRTIWRDGLRLEQAQLHQRTLALVLSSRNILVRTLVAAIDGAVKLSLLMAVPGGALLALPTAWKFIADVLAEAAPLEDAKGN